MSCAGRFLDLNLSDLTMQNFLAGSAANIGARPLQHCAQQLYLAARTAAAAGARSDPSKFVPRQLIDQVLVAIYP